MTGRVAVTHQDWVDSLTAEKYVLGELSVRERDDFEEHFFECSECAESIRRLSQLKAGVRTELRDVVAGAPVLQSRRNWLEQIKAWWARPQGAFVGALAALAIAGVVSYQNVQLKNRLQPQSVQSILLAPATRGSLPVLNLQSVGSFVLLEADLPAASGDLTWTVRAKGGQTSVDGAGRSPEPGLTFKVLIPAAQLRSGEYTLTVRSGHGKEWQFEFQTGGR